MLSVRNTVADASHKVHIKVKMYNERDISDVYYPYIQCRLPYCLKHGKLRCYDGIYSLCGFNAPIQAID